MSALAINRRGACPALSAPMQTGDGLLVRLNPVSQALTPIQLIGLCESAARHGNGVMEITQRGSLQIRGLTPESAPQLAHDVNSLDIAVRTGVPIDISPLAGLDPREIADARPLAETLRAAISRAGLASRLGPKVSVIIDGGGQIDLRQIAADIRLIAARRRNGAFWRIALSGDAHTAEPMGGASTAGAVSFALDLLEQIAGLGLEARGRDLIHDQPSPPLLIPPHKGERGVNLGAPQSTSGGSPESPSPLRGGVRGGGSAIVLGDDRIALAIALPFGTALADDLAALAKATQKIGAGDLRLAPGRRLLALCPDLACALALREAVTSLGFIIDPADPRLAISACAGAPACASGRIATRMLAERTAADAPDLVARVGDLHISGCEKGCAHPADAPLTLVGKAEGVGVVVNGKARDAARTVVSASDLPEALNAILPAGS